MATLNLRAAQWEKQELSFTSDFAYPDPLRNLHFYALFTTPSGRTFHLDGFWDSGLDWKVRLMPDKVGEWRYETVCSDIQNPGLHHQQGTFVVEESHQEAAIYRHGAVLHRPGEYHLRHADGTPFLWVACTAWNGTLKSTEEEWDTYLQHRREHHYSVIQFVTTQWRGGDQNSEGQTAFSGKRAIQLNPKFFQHLDHKIDQINAHGLVAAPVLLWALPRGEGKALSPGYALPRSEAILLAKYMVARYGAHHVVWLLGGDGLYTHFYQRRWKRIGRAVFGQAKRPLVARITSYLRNVSVSIISTSRFIIPCSIFDIFEYRISNKEYRMMKWYAKDITHGTKAGDSGYFLSFLYRKFRTASTVDDGKMSAKGRPTERRPVALHPMGRSWIGKAYAQEAWLDVIGYQSGHGSDKKSVEFVTRGPATQSWKTLPPRPLINMEPCYEEIGGRVSADDVRHASYWSLLATPLAGISYGANGIWPWIRPGERILNHGALSQQEVRSWRESLDLPGSLQVGYLSQFIQQFDWWTLRPDPDLLVWQSGERDYLHYVSVVRTEDCRTMLAYIPTDLAVEILNPKQFTYRVRWFDPVQGIDQPEAHATVQGKTMQAKAPLATGNVLILTKI